MEKKVEIHEKGRRGEVLDWGMLWASTYNKSYSRRFCKGLKKLKIEKNNKASSEWGS